MSESIFLCAISNIASGSCNEDCGFCAQSARWNASIERYKTKPIDTIVAEARAAKAAGAVGFCLVTAGKGVDDKLLEYVCRAASAVTAADLELTIIACNGTVSSDQLSEMKKAGVSAYNHNLETSERFFPQICTTHSWSERFEVCERINAAGLALICGGIFGLGENEDDRKSFLLSLRKLRPFSVPLNFFIANDSLPIKQGVIATNEAIRLVAKARGILGDAPRIMLAGGKEQAFGTRLTEAIEAGANALVVGNYLTTEGMHSSALRKMLLGAGYAIATPAECGAAKKAHHG
ncbi:biotin synthase [Campylobacterota bacterium]|nr:biotin synthase [Campylobacterota bacterium]